MGSACISQFFCFGKGNIRFTGPSDCFENNGLVVPGSDKVGIDLDSPIERINSFIVLTKKFRFRFLFSWALR